jgi:hypothetical protein
MKGPRCDRILAGTTFAAIVSHYKVRRRTSKLLRHAFEFAELPFDKNANPFTAVIRCTSNGNADGKTISATRVLIGTQIIMDDAPDERSTSVAEPEDGSPRRLPSLSSDHPPAAPHMMSATLWCRDQTLACRNYPTLAPEENRVYPSNSRHRVATPYSPDAIGTFQDCYPIRNFTKRPSLDCSWSGFRYRC